MPPKYLKDISIATLFGICKALFLLLFALILYSIYAIPDLLNRNDVEFSILYSDSIGVLLPALLSVIIPLILLDSLKNRIALYLLYPLYMWLMAGPYIIFVLPVILASLLSLIIGHYVLEIFKKEGVARIMIPVLGIALMASLITWIVLINNHDKRVIEIRTEHETSWNAWEIAAKNKDPRLCENISEQSTKDSCYWEFGRELKDASLCNKIQSLNLKKPCLEIASVKDCGDIATPASRDDCFLQVAGYSVHSDICREIRNPASRDDCFMQVAVNIKLASGCDDIQNQSMKSKCFNDVVSLITIARRCENMFLQADRDDCLLQTTKDNRYLTWECDDIQDQSVKSKCYDDMVLLKDNLCDDIQDQSVRSKCHVRK